MRGVTFVARSLMALVVVGFIANCGDDPVSPDRADPAAPAIAFATASNGAGLSITTDKDDYAPGDTVWFTGAGWTPGDSVDIVLTDDPTLDSHSWAVGIGEDGGFRDSTYVVDINDLGVTFTLTATSRGNPGQTLTVTFTDGSLSLAAPTKPSGFQSFPVPSPFPAAGITFTAANSATPAGAHTNVKLRIRAAGNLNPTPPTLRRELDITASLAVNSQASVVWDGNDGSATPLAEGLYGARVLSTERNEQNNSDLDVLVDRTPPAISSPAVSLSPITSGTNTAITLTGTASDPIVAGVNANNYNVLSARYQLDGAPAAGTAMSPADGNFNGQTEGLTATIPGATIAALTPGSHLFCMRATDASGNAGAFTITGNPNCATLVITSVDAQAPTINCTVPDQSIWYGADVTVNCTASDASGLANSADASFSLSTSVSASSETETAQTTSHQVCDNLNNCATAGPYTFKVDKKSPTFSCGAADGLWHGADVSINCTASDGGSGVSPLSDGTFTLSTNVAANSETDNASTGTKELSDAVGNKVTAGPIAGNKVDKKAPTFSCGTADGLWHALDVSISCTAADGGSGVSPLSDASFSLSTSVAADTETDDASTGTKEVSDAVGNQATAGPIAGNKVDKKGPTVNLVCPASPVILGSTEHANWTATDGGSGVATGASGSVLLATGTVGSKTATAAAGSAVDAVGNGSPAAECTYSVNYHFDGLFAPVDRPNTMNVSKAGQSIPLKWRLTDSQGNPVLNFSPAALGVAVTGLQCTVSTTLDQIEEYAGNSGLQNLGDGYYQFNWKTPPSYANSCKAIGLNLGEATARGPLAYFNFKK